MDQLHHHAISLYIPSLTAMLNTQHPWPAFKATSATRLLTIAQSSMERHSAHAFGLQKIEPIRRCLISLRSKVRPTAVHLRDNEAPIERIMHGLNQSSFVHFACHAQANRDNSREISSILEDDNRRLLLKRFIHRELGQRRRRLAVLSACMTAVGHEARIRYRTLFTYLFAHRLFRHSKQLTDSSRRMNVTRRYYAASIPTIFTASAQIPRVLTS
jgi:hypothetical protein